MSKNNLHFNSRLITRIGSRKITILGGHELTLDDYGSSIPMDAHLPELGPYSEQASKDEPRR